MASYPRPVYPKPQLSRALNAFAASAFVGTLASDIAYWRTMDFIWADVSDWLVSIGVVVGFVAFLVGVVEFFAVRSAPRAPWASAMLNAIAWILAVMNMFVHSRDGWTSVVPSGLYLSALVVLALAVSSLTLRRAAIPIVLPANAESAP